MPLLQTYVLSSSRCTIGQFQFQYTITTAVTSSWISAYCKKCWHHQPHAGIAMDSWRSGNNSQHERDGQSNSLLVVLNAVKTQFSTAAEILKAATQRKSIGKEGVNFWNQEYITAVLIHQDDFTSGIFTALLNSASKYLWSKKYSAVNKFDSNFGWCIQI